MKQFIGLLFLLFTPLFSQAAELRVHVPFICPLVCDENVNGKRGYAIDILEKIYSPIGIKIDFKRVPWQRSIIGAKTGNNDVLIGIFKMRPEEEEVWKSVGIMVDVYNSLIYPQEQVFDWNEAGIFVRSGSTWTYDGESSLSDIRFGTYAGYSYSALNTYLQNNQDRDDRLSGGRVYQRNFQRLIQKKVDVVLANEYMARFVIGQMVSQGELPSDAVKYLGYFPGSIPRKSYVAFSPKRKDARELADIYDREIKKLRKSGQLKKILDRYNVDDWI